VSWTTRSPASLPVSFSIDIEGFLAGAKRPGREAGHTSFSSTELADASGYTSVYPYTFIVWLSALNVVKFTLLKNQKLTCSL
jgi:hypothetical protein